MQEAAIRAQLAAVRAEFKRVEAEYHVLVDLTEGYVRWLHVLGLEDEQAAVDDGAEPTLAPDVVGRADEPAEDAEEDQASTGHETSGEPAPGDERQAEATATDPFPREPWPAEDHHGAEVRE